MTSFLQRLAHEMASRFGDDLQHICVVLPNRRAGLYLKKYLAAELNKTSWAPKTYSVEDFITELSGFGIIDQAGLLFELYHIHKEIQGDKAQEFDVFADWAQVLLKDFNEIDQYLVDPEKIFTYLNAVRAMSVWNLDLTPLTEQEKSYIEFYQSFLVYYRHLHQNLSEKKLAYEGLAYRYAAENIAANASSLSYKKVLFAGLNALSAAEEKIISYLVEQDKAEVFWDADEYYIKDEHQEAGKFIREQLKKWPADPVKWIGNDFRQMPKTIRVFGVPGSTGQAQKAGQIISRLTSGDQAPDRTALVLADEKLLLPALFALPEEIGPVNVTMGYPFKYTQIYQLTGLLFRMQENAEKFAEQRKNQAKAYYVKDIIKLLSHPYLSVFIPDHPTTQASFEGISNDLKKKNRVFMRPEELTAYVGKNDGPFRPLFEQLFTAWGSPSEALDRVLKIMEHIRDRFITENRQKPAGYELDLEYFFHASKIIKRCRSMMEKYPYITQIKTLKKILFQLFDTGRLPFSGEPLQGIQVMGVLETRAIDFENLVVLSVNEGTLPSGRLPNSFIPFDIKSEFGLPTFLHKDAVFAYHFYHMLQRAGNIYLLYDTESDQMKGGEKSRFITQIAYELTKYNPGIKVEEILLRPNPPKAGQVKKITVNKTPSVMERLMLKADKGFSPTALNLYIKCSLKFYFQEILGLTEAETIEETIEAKTMGTVIHEVFQRIYDAFTGKVVEPESLLQNLDKTEQYLREAFRVHYREGDLEHGKNHLIFKVSLFLVNQFLTQEAEKLSSTDHKPSLIIQSLENSFKHAITCKVSGQDMQVNLKGKTDRIDRLDGITRIIDYKTGSVQASELNLKSWDKLITDPKMAKAFQLLLYAWLYHNISGVEGEMIQTGNISLRKISAGFMKVKLPDDRPIDRESMETFGEYLKALLENILNPELQFSQTDDEENCKYCPFTAICTR